MIQAFAVTSSSPPTSPSSAQKLIARSSSASDTQNLTLTGTVAGPSNVTETRALVGKKEVQFATNTLVTLTGAILASAANGVVSVYQPGTAANGTIFVSSLPANNDTLVIGLVSLTQTYTFKSSLTGAANEIKIAATVAAQATNIYEAIDAGANAGTDYGTGTVANAYVTAAAPSGASVTITDKLAVNRLLGWTLSQTVGATLSLTSPIGGADGTLLASIAIAGTQSVANMNFNNPTLASSPLVAGSTPTTDAIAVRGKPTSIRIYSADLSSTVTAKVQASDDTKVTWYDVATGLSIDNNDQRVNLTAILSEWIRIVITANANTTDSAIHMVAISN